MKDKSNNIKRSDIWNNIYEVLARLDLKETDGDSFDRPSAATEIEALLQPSQQISEDDIKRAALKLFPYGQIPELAHYRDKFTQGAKWLQSNQQPHKVDNLVLMLKNKIITTYQKFGDKKALLIKGKHSYTGNEVANEILKETEFGKERVASTILLTIDLLSRDKVNQQPVVGKICKGGYFNDGECAKYGGDCTKNLCDYYIKSLLSKEDEVRECKIPADSFSRNRTKEEAIELIKKEGNQMTYQFKEWWDLFELQSWGRKSKMSELEMHSCLSNRFELKRK